MDKISILFKEYDTLRTEAISRGSSRYQVIGLGVAVLTWLLSRPFDTMFFVSLATVLTVFLLLSHTAIRDIDFIARRLRELESEINECAGSKLLKWETHWGGGVTGFLWRQLPRAKEKKHPARQ